MKTLQDFESRMVHDGKRNNREVKIICEQCGGESWQRWQRVKTKLKNGRHFFCSLECTNKWQEEEGKKTWGRENARFHWDEDRQCWYAYWKDKNGIQRSTTKARWLWEHIYGKIKRNQVVTYIDGNPENCELDNLKMMSRSEWNKVHLIGHEISKETKEKLSNAHSGKILSDNHKLKIAGGMRKAWEDGKFESVHVGENHNRWKGGIKPYPRKFNDRLKRKIKRRDKYLCQACGENVYGSRFGHVHHIDGNKQNCEESNLILLCMTCHSAVHGFNNVTSESIEELRGLLK